MADIFEIIGRISLDGLNDAERDLNNLSGAGEQSASKLSKLGGIAKTVGKGVLLATGAVATGAVALVKSVQGSYGELQQNLGGSEAVFGEYAQNIQKIGEDAYKNMGMSQSEFLATANKMGSLLQGSGISQRESLDLTAQAMQRASDVASVMGIDMQSAMESITGACKGNFTMMDNLGVAMNATNLEAYALEKGLTNFSWKTASQAEKNTLAMQMFLERTEQYAGNFARESTETITGAMGNISSAWQDFIAGLGNPEADMERLTKNLASSFNGMVMNIVPLIENITNVLPIVLPSIVNAISDLAPTLIETFTNVITKTIDAIIPLLPTVIPLFVDMLVKVGMTLAQNAPILIDGFIQLITQLTVAVSENLPTLIPIFIECLVQIGQALIENAPIILDAILSIGSNFENGLSPAISACVSAVEVLTGAFVAFKAGAMIQSVVQGFQSAQVALALFRMETQGASIAQGLLNGQLTIGQTVVGLLTGQVTLAEVATGLWSKAQAVLNAVMSANPIALIVMAIGAVIAIIVVAYNKCDWFREAVNKLGEGIKKAFTAIIEWFKKLPETISNAVNNVVNFIKELPEKIGYWLGFVLGKVVKFATEFPAKAKEAGQNFVNSLINFIKNLPTNIQNLLTTVITKVAEWGINLATTGKNGATQLFNAVVNGVRELPNRIVNIGKNIVEGLWNGITNAKDWLVEKISSFTGGVVDGFKDALGIHSPSAVMRDEVGKPIADGVGEGISENMKYVMQGLDDDLSDMLKGAKTQYDRLFELYESGKITRSEYESIYNKILEENSDVRIQLAEYEADKMASYNKQVENERKSALRDRLSDAKDTFNELFELYEDEKITKENFESEYAVIVKKYGDVRVDLEKYTQDKISDYEDKKHKERMKATETAIKNLTSNFESKISSIKSKVDGFAGKVSKSFNGMFNFTTNKDVYDTGLKGYEDKLEKLNKSLEESKSKYGENSQQVKNYEKQIADLNKTIEEYKKNHDETKDSEIVNVKATSQITKSTKEINDYIKTIETLKERGINDTMLKELSGMDQDEGMALANYWNSLDDTQLTALANNWQKYNDSLQNLGETLYSDEIDSALTEYKTKVKENLDGLPKDCVEVGINVVKGLWDGVNETGGWLQERISSFCNSIIAKFKKSFQIESPSKVMAGLGVYITQGLGVGITDDDSAEKAIDEKVNSIINTANNSLNNTKFGIDTMIAESPMQKYQLDFNAQIGALNDGFDRLIGLVGNYLPNISENINRPIAVDGNNLAMTISKQMDNQLGRMAISKDRGNV